MTLTEAMNYRGENAATLSGKLGMREGDVKRWMKPTGIMEMNAKRMKEMAAALDGGVLITADGAEVELY